MYKVGRLAKPGEQGQDQSWQSVGASHTGDRRQHIKCAVFSGGPVTSQSGASARSPTSVSKNLPTKVRDLTDLMLYSRSGYYCYGPGE